LQNLIECHEISTTAPDFYFLRATLTRLPEDDSCKGVAFDRPFDSARWQSKAPIFYWAGTRDPNTPYFDARYHFDNQKSAKRFFVSVAEGGHNKLGNIVGDCKEEVWNSILSGGQNFSHAIKHCQMPLSLEER
jgi:hypothetical protein